MTASVYSELSGLSDKAFVWHSEILRDLHYMHCVGCLIFLILNLRYIEPFMMVPWGSIYDQVLPLQQ